MKSKLLQKSKYNKSAYFILPLLNIPFREFNQGVGGFINTYMDSNLYFSNEKINERIQVLPPLDYYIHVLLNRRVLDFDSFDCCIQINSGLIEARQDKDFVLFVYRIPMPYHSTVNLFWKGKYSQFRKDVKQTISKYIKKEVRNTQTNKIEENINWRALFPNEESREALSILLSTPINKDMEILSKPKAQDETLPIEVPTGNLLLKK
jgi:hypothetical protein